MPLIAVCVALHVIECCDQCFVVPTAEAVINSGMNAGSVLLLRVSVLSSHALLFVEQRSRDVEVTGANIIIPCRPLIDVDTISTSQDDKVIVYLSVLVFTIKHYFEK